MTRVLLVDDLRVSDLPGYDVVYARTSAAALLLLERDGLGWDEVWLDWDLGEDDDARPVVRWLEEHRPPLLAVRTVSMNPVGVQSIERALAPHYAVSVLRSPLLAVPEARPTEAKQVIVVRKDLGMRKGKMIAQGAHASIAFLTRKLEATASLPYPGARVAVLSLAEAAWVEGRFTKVCVGVSSEEELLAVHAAALGAGLTSSLITDAGLTEFHGVPTNTCLAVGPDWADRVDPVTGHLALL